MWELTVRSPEPFAPFVTLWRYGELCLGFHDARPAYQLFGVPSACGPLRSNIANVAPRNLLPRPPPTPMLSRVVSIRVDFERQNRIQQAA